MMTARIPAGRRAMSQLSSLPSVERVLQTERASALVAGYGRPLTLEAIRTTLEEARSTLRSGPTSPPPGLDSILAGVESRITALTRPSLQPVINATGVILHTNLGRAPLSRATLAAMAAAAQGYSNLELDLETGKRGDRFTHVEAILKSLTGAQAALIVNNNASAVMLALTALAARRKVIIARSQLVEIGGGFRMPDVMRQSGAKMLEVGTTNKVRLQDYAEMFSEAALVMRVHRSNFKLVGFTAEPPLREIAEAAHRAGLSVVDDLGSGALLDTADYGLAHEPTVQESLGDGADLVCFSGDKLVGGPQCGIIVGRKELVDRLKKHPMARALRADKTCLAGIAATLGHYARDEAEREIPIWSMVAATGAQLRHRAEGWASALGAGEVVTSESALGGGSLPGETLPTYVLSIDPRGADRLLDALRRQQPPIIGRAEKDKVLLDPRTVLPEEEADFVAGLRSAWMETR